MVFEPEFARVLKVCSRDGSTLSQIIRGAWDRDCLRILTRHKPLQADGIHVSIVGHITVEELRRYLTETETASGFANRFLFVCVEGAQRLPSGGSLDERTLANLGQAVRQAAIKARKIEQLETIPQAEALWRDFYKSINDEVDGLFGAATARAQAQVLRLSVTYALLDTIRIINADHLRAALALWQYCEDSAAYIFRHRLDPLADRLLQALCEAGSEGLDATAQSALFGRNIPAPRLEAVRQSLEARSLIRTIEQPTAGRPRKVSYAVRNKRKDEQRSTT